MGIGIITNPLVILFATIVLLKELGIINPDLTGFSILMILLYLMLTYISLHT